MLITKVKTKEELLPALTGRVLVIPCLGCSQSYFPLEEFNRLKDELKASGANLASEVTFDYMCREDFTERRLEIYREQIEAADTVLVFSCGVGIQTFAGLLPGKKIVSGSDTFYVPGFPGFTPSEHDCEQCGECRMGLTFGICPVTACSKGLLNGQCGGAKDGKCEVDKNMACGWQRIFERMSALKGSDKGLKEGVQVRDYKKSNI